MATYYVSAAGSDSNNGLSTGAPWLTVAKVNATTFVAGDIILFRRGDSWAENLACGQSGSSGNVITYGQYGAGLLPIINPASGSPITIATKNYVTIDGLKAVRAGTSTSDRAIQCSGSCTGISVKNSTLDSPGYGMDCSGTMTTFLFEDITVLTRATQTFGLYLYGSGNTGVTVRRAILNKSGIQIRNTASPVVDTVTGTGLNSSALLLRDCTGTPVVNDVVDTGNTVGGALDFLTCSFTGGTFTDCIADGCGGTGINGYGLVGTAAAPVRFIRCEARDGTGAGVNGFAFTGSSAYIQVEDGLAGGNPGDGFLTSAANDVRWLRCFAIGNGTNTSTAAGDGFTSHFSDYNITCEKCVSAFNVCSGYAMVGNSHGTIYQSVAMGNASNFTDISGLDQVRGGFFLNVDGVNATTGGSWTVTDCVGAWNYPREVFISSAGASIVTMNSNTYKERRSASFATINGASSNISWATYSSREPASVNDATEVARKIKQHAGKNRVMLLAA